MATNSSTTTIPSSFSIPVAEKLTKSHYHLWKTQILPPIRAVQHEGFLHNTAEMPAEFLKEKSGDKITEVPNPVYTRWMTRDQALLGYIFSLLTREVLMSVTTHYVCCRVGCS
jgi:hypothetical protein